MPSPLDYYPSPEEVDAWCGRVLDAAREADLTVKTSKQAPYDFRLGVRHTGGQYLYFKSRRLGEFFGFWQPCPSGRGPLLVHVPGYGAEMSAHPELVADGYNVLHVNPLGYATPEGPDESKRPTGTWPVLPDTVESLGERGYVDWLGQGAAAALWAAEQDEVTPGRLAFFGTSQGGGGALLLASIVREAGVRAVAADVPFLTNYAMAYSGRMGAYAIGLEVLRKVEQERQDDVPAAWRALGFVDTISHSHRLTMPTLLTAGGADESCPVESIRSLFDRLPGTRSFTELAGQGHAYTMPFLNLARAWFRLHV